MESRQTEPFYSEYIHEHIESFTILSVNDMHKKYSPDFHEKMISRWEIMFFIIYSKSTIQIPKSQTVQIIQQVCCQIYDLSSLTLTDKTVPIQLTFAEICPAKWREKVSIPWEFSMQYQSSRAL